MRFYLKKIGFYLVALFAALTLNFAIPRLMPGDPVSAVLTRLASRGGTVAPGNKGSDYCNAGTRWRQHLPAVY